MELRRFKFVTKTRSYNFKLVLFGDQHAYNVSCNEDLIKRTVKVIHNDPDMYWVGMGDYIDAITRKDKRFDARTTGSRANRNIRVIDTIVDSAVNQFCGWVESIKGKCLGLLPGNHEETVRQNDGGDIIGKILEKLRLTQTIYTPTLDIGRYDKDLGTIALLTLHFERNYGLPKNTGQNIDICLSHGKGSATTDAGTISILTKLRNMVDADVYGIGHCHRLIVTHPAKLCKIGNPSRFRLGKKEQLCIATSSFLNTYEEGVSGYGEKALYEPKVLGSAVLNIKPFHSYRMGNEGIADGVMIDAYRLEV